MIKGKISIGKTSSNGENATPIKIELRDTDAVIEFAIIYLSLENYAQVITGLSHVECDIEVRDLDKVGKVRQQDILVIEMPQETDWKKQKEIAYEIAKAKCPEGWIASSYFNSQNSFFKKDGKEYAQTQIVRWVEKPTT